ncbi:MAG: hypothetical protein NTY45_12105 [Elusimicrobia bacterium]|nr:hypothetical protein [Elusimicrobiota bacterium]
MKNRILASCLALAILAGAGVIGARAQDKAKAKNEVVTKTGVIEIIKADPAKKEKYDTILLKIDKETIKLLPGADKKAFKPLEKLNGKTVTVTGELLPPNPPKYPLAALKVASVAKAAAPAAPVKK